MVKVILDEYYLKLKSNHFWIDSKGTYGVVFKAIDIDGKMVALKRIRLEKYLQQISYEILK